jgi:diaminohydroxyphosphoribosylaminopyrimidine deaminase/5-amino-6-(5-phosphoribosylamino)uracil reductase
VDREHLERAVVLGRRGWGGVHPNPLVGCVLVRDGVVVGEGWHEEFGGPHAETRALEKAGPEAEGATAYVSLEPCRHEGKTPACTGALVASGIRRVVYGAADPGAESGGGGAELRRAGLEVVGPVFDARRAWSENPAFHDRVGARRTHVSLKLALSLDGRIAAGPGERTALTGEAARREVHRLRSGFHGILIGSGTALVDDPLLTVRDVPLRRPAPVRVLLDSRLRIGPEAALFRDVATTPLWIFCREDAPESRMERLEAAGARVHPVPGGEARAGVPLGEVLDRCGTMGLESLLCEGGGRLAAALLEGGNARRFYALLAPLSLGQGGVPGLPHTGPIRWRPVREPRVLGPDLLLTLDRAD